MGKGPRLDLELRLLLELRGVSPARRDVRFKCRLNDRAIHNIDLVTQAGLLADVRVTGESQSQLVPSSGCGHDGHSAIHQSAAGQVPSIIIMIDIEAAQRNQDSASSKPKPF